MYKRAFNTCVNFFLARVKYVRNFTLFCRKSELFCDFALLGVKLMPFNLVNFYFYLKKERINCVLLCTVIALSVAWHLMICLFIIEHNPILDTRTSVLLRNAQGTLPEF